MEFGGWWFVVVVFYVPTVLYCSTDLLYKCSKKKTQGGPRAQKGSRATGATRGNIPRAPQGREERVTVLSTKLTAPEPRIARAPELVML